MHNAWSCEQDAARTPAPDRDQAVQVAGARRVLWRGAGTSTAGVDGRAKGARNMCAMQGTRARVCHGIAWHGMALHGTAQHAWAILGLILHGDAQPQSQEPENKPSCMRNRKIMKMKSK